MKKEILRMERVTLKEDGDTQLENFSLTVWEGEIVGLVPVDNHGLSPFLKLLRQNTPSLRKFFPISYTPSNPPTISRFK